MSATFSISFPERVFVGAGISGNMAEYASILLAKKAALVTDMSLYKLGMTAKIEKSLKDNGIDTLVINDINGEPTTEEAQAVFEKVRDFKADIIIALGGGSVIDVVKVAALLFKNGEGNIYNLFPAGSVKNFPMKTIIIPTTAGTGAETTQNAIFIDSRTGRKESVISPLMLPSIVIIDPELTVGLPKFVTAFSGMDAFAHCAECYIGKKNNPFSEFYALKGVELIAKNIRIAYNDPGNLDARVAMQIGAMYGGTAIAAAGTTAVHALAYPLGARFHVPHGVSNAMLLPSVFEYSMDAMEDKLAVMGKYMGLDVEGKSASEAARLTIDELYKFNADLGIPTKLQEYGVKPEDVDILVEEGMAVRRLLDNNPKEVTKEAATKLYKGLF